MNELDKYIGNVQAFPILRRWNFFNHAGVAPLPHLTADALRKFAEEGENGAYLGTTWYKDIELLRQSFATLMNAHRDEIAFVKNTSEGISIVAKGLEWQWGDRIVTSSVEYPANIYPWMEVARSHGAKLVMVDEETASDGWRKISVDKILEQAADPRTRLVAISHVEYASGQRIDIARIGQFCRANKKLFCVDAIQTLGVLPLDVQAMNIDFLSADGHKWMLGPEGAGVFYCRKELVERTGPLMVGWMNVVNALDYGNYDYTLRPDAGRFECGSYNVVGLMGLKASLEMLREVGTERIAIRLKEITDRLIRGLKSKGYAVLSPRGEGEWSGIVSFASPTHHHDTIVRTLRRDHQTEIALREGRLRASPHFYNTDAQIDRLVELLPGH